MSKKHFVFIAAQIKSESDRAKAKIMFDFAVEFCIEFNPRFDLDRFQEACGLALQAPSLHTVCGGAQ